MKVTSSESYHYHGPQFLAVVIAKDTFKRLIVTVRLSMSTYELKVKM